MSFLSFMIALAISMYLLDTLVPFDSANQDLNLQPSHYQPERTETISGLLPNLNMPGKNTRPVYYLPYSIYCTHISNCSRKMMRIRETSAGHRTVLLATGAKPLPPPDPGIPDA